MLLSRNGINCFPIETKIRRATKADLAVVAEFNYRLALETEDLALDRGRLRAGVERVLTDPSLGVYYVAEFEGAVVGQLMITYEWSDWRNGMIWWLQSVFVQPEFRRAGVFRALFAHAEREAKAKADVCSVRLYMHHANEKARRTYEQVGMKRTHYVVFEMDVAPAPDPSCTGSDEAGRAQPPA